MAAVAIYGNHHVIGLHVGHLRRRPLEYIDRVGAAVIFAEQHADPAAVIGGSEVDEEAAKRLASK